MPPSPRRRGRGGGGRASDKNRFGQLPPVVLPTAPLPPPLAPSTGGPLYSERRPQRPEVVADRAREVEERRAGCHRKAAPCAGGQLLHEGGHLLPRRPQEAAPLLLPPAVLRAQLELPRAQGGAPERLLRLSETCRCVECGHQPVEPAVDRLERGGPRAASARQRRRGRRGRGRRGAPRGNGRRRGGRGAAPLEGSDVAPHAL